MSEKKKKLLSLTLSFPWLPLLLLLRPNRTEFLLSADSWQLTPKSRHSVLNKCWHDRSLLGESQLSLQTQSFTSSWFFYSAALVSCRNAVNELWLTFRTHRRSSCCCSAAAVSLSRFDLMQKKKCQSVHPGIKHLFAVLCSIYMCYALIGSLPDLSNENESCVCS